MGNIQKKGPNRENNPHPQSNVFDEIHASTIHDWINGQSDKTRTLSQDLRMIRESLEKDPQNLGYQFQHGEILYKLSKDPNEKDAKAFANESYRVLWTFLQEALKQKPENHSLLEKQINQAKPLLKEMAATESKHPEKPESEA